MMRMRIGKLAEESEIPSDVVPFAGMSSFHQIKKRKQKIKNKT